MSTCNLPPPPPFALLLLMGLRGRIRGCCWAVPGFRRGASQEWECAGDADSSLHLGCGKGCRYRPLLLGVCWGCSPACYLASTPNTLPTTGVYTDRLPSVNTCSQLIHTMALMVALSYEMRCSAPKISPPEREPPSKTSTTTSALNSNTDDCMKWQAPPWGHTAGNTAGTTGKNVGTRCRAGKIVGTASKIAECWQVLHM